MTIENNIREMRMKKDVTQEQLAWVVGVSRQTVIAMEKGNYIPSLLLAIKLARFFDISVEKLFRLQ